MKKILLFAVAATMALTSCKESGEDIDAPVVSAELAAFTSAKAEPALYFGGGKFATVDIENEQITYLEDRTLYMVSDMEYTKSYELDLDGELKLDNTVDVYFDANGYAELEDKDVLEMKVAKVSDDENTVWLWNEESILGLILHFEPIEE